MEVEKLKKNFLEFETKYKLPTFSELDENFEIFKIDRESDALLRAIRKQMMEKIVNSVGFVEMLLNPLNAPRMYFSYVKSLTIEDRKMLEQIYSAFSELIISSLQAEVEYSEKNEAELIKKVFSIWEANKKNFVKILESIKKPNGFSVKKERNYFG